ncbi:hypothetical protein FYJ43_02750 [Cutibacterium sp. WCA-380-WT-3A]|uniref:Glyoxalase n=1 Tax=Cutibacterium porci TaxID=2605781 RepID=A0A7K0J501_9ACTN|nr:hypothetical protein [Cutibacterium porci]MSS44987.1 hypothetical protein [Cutibacterium porci]
MKNCDIIFNDSINESDLCARSGLHSPSPMVAIYVENLEVASGFYRQLFPTSAVRFENDEVFCMELDERVEIFIQKVEKDSVFGELCGKQTVAVSVSEEVFNSAGQNLPETASLDVETWTGGPAVDDGFMFGDVEGNRVLLMPVRETAATA